MSIPPQGEPSIKQLVNDPRNFAKPVKAISLPQDVPSTSDRRLIKLKNQVQRLMESHLAPKPSVQVKKSLLHVRFAVVPTTLNIAWKIPSKLLLITHPRVLMKREEHSQVTQLRTPKLNVNSTSPVLSVHSYPTEDPQCSSRIHNSINVIIMCSKKINKSHNDQTQVKEEGREEKRNLKNINNTLPSPPDPSILFITEKVCKINSFLESSGLVPRSADMKFVCTKEDDGDVMFIEIIKMYDDSCEKELKEDENAMT
ncbi:hypothetical protein Tco_0179727 [Tanacetum coccineum]